MKRNFGTDKGLLKKNTTKRACHYCYSLNHLTVHLPFAAAAAADDDDDDDDDDEKWIYNTFGLSLLI